MAITDDLYDATYMMICFSKDASVEFASESLAAEYNIPITFEVSAVNEAGESEKSEPVELLFEKKYPIKWQD